MPNTTTPRRRLAHPLWGLLVAVLATAGLAGCSSGGDELVIYSGRNENLVRPILERFEKETGTKISVRYGTTSDLAPTLLEEGRSTKADVFFSQDAGALAALAEAELFAALPDDVLSDVDERFRDPDGFWVGVTGRARVMAYSTERVQAGDLPESVFELTGPEWKGRVGFPPTNASFVAFVSALIEQAGEDRAKAWLEGLKANDAKTYDNNVATIEGILDGEIDLGLVNHYYLYSRFKTEGRDVPVANHYPGQTDGGEGTFVNIAGVGVIAGSDKADDAQELVRFLLDEEAQEYFRDETTEYPLSAGVQPVDELPPLDDIRTIDVPLTRLGEDLERSLRLLKDVGLT